MRLLRQHIDARSTAHRGAAKRRERALTHEVSTLRRVVAVALAEKSFAMGCLSDVERDAHNGVSIARHLKVCQQLHEAESRIRHLEGTSARG